MSKHTPEPTPGPWEYEIEAGDEWWFGKGMGMQAVIRCEGADLQSVVAVMACDNEEEKANARLISAAPDMAEALEAVLQFWGDHDAWGDFASLTSAAGKFAPVADKVRAALKKAGIQ